MAFGNYYLNWSDNKTSRIFINYGYIFIGDNWIYSYSRMQRNVILSSTESEYVALIFGIYKGLLVKAVLTYLVGNGVMLKLCADNILVVAIIGKKEKFKIKYLSGKFL